eukprot:scaffold10.g2447.t1
MPGRSLLYIGAGWDLLLLRNAVEHWGYATLVCVDALPAMPHYTPRQAGYRNAHSLEVLLAAVRRRLLHLGCALSEEADPAHSLHTLRCSGTLEATMDYFDSTPNTQMLANAALAARLPHVSGLIVKGYQPAPEVLAPAVLPAVRELYLSELCHCGTLPAAREATAERLTGWGYDWVSDEEGIEYDPDALFSSYYPSDYSGS